MKASIVDLRYKMNDILKALERNEEVTVLYHGKVKGVIVPARPQKPQKMTSHPFFGMTSGENQKSVDEVLDEMRGPRYSVI